MDDKTLNELKENVVPGERYYCTEDAMVVCDVICDACFYRYPEDTSSCKRYPQGKPDELLNPDYYCPKFSMSGFKFRGED